MSVVAEAKKLVERAEAVGLRGVTIPGNHLRDLVCDLKMELPLWLTELLTTVPLCGLEFGWQAFDAEPRFDGIQWLEWSDAQGIRIESLEGYPGIAILGHGYINVASCSGGTGDPYFVCVNEGSDPPIYQVYHDISDKPELILAEGRRVVAPTLSQFFREALVIKL